MERIVFSPELPEDFSCYTVNVQDRSEVSTGYEEVAECVFSDGIDVIHVPWIAFFHVADGVVGFGYVDVVTSAPFEDCLACFQVKLLEDRIPNPAFARIARHAFDVCEFLVVNGDERRIVRGDGEGMKIGPQPIRGFDAILLAILLIQHVMGPYPMSTDSVIAGPEREIRLAFV